MKNKYYTRDAKIAYWKRKIAYAQERIKALEAPKREQPLVTEPEIQELLKRILENGDKLQNQLKNIRKKKGA